MQKARASLITCFLKNYTDAAEAALAAGREVLDGAGSVIDHAHQHGAALVQMAEQAVCAGSVRHDCAVSVKGTPVVEKAPPLKISTSGADDGTLVTIFTMLYVSKIPVIDISSGPGGTVEKLYLFHMITVLSLKKPEEVCDFSCISCCKYRREVFFPCFFCFIAEAKGDGHKVCSGLLRAVSVGGGIPD